MKTSNRLIRINEELQRETSEIIRTELKDPRVNQMVSVVKVDTTNDLALCKIYVSILGDEQQKKEVMNGINSASGFIRKQLAARVNLRNTPQLKFIQDDSIEYAARLSKLIDDANKS